MLNWIKFLGTAGGRVVVFRQLRHSGGMWLKLGEVNLLIDPGPASLVRIYEAGLDPKDVDVFILSHRHLDHSADLNSVIEAATESTKRKKDLLVAPYDAVEGEDPVLLKYLKKGINKIVHTQEGMSVLYKGIEIKALIKHRHKGADTYGLSFSSKGKTVVYVPCGRFFEDMLEKYPAEADLMILNTTFVKPKPEIDHLSAEDVKVMLKKLKPKKAVITHFSVQMLKANPEKVAKEITKETGVLTTAAVDQMKLQF